MISVMQFLQKMVAPVPTNLDDEELLNRFVAHCDEDAFSALIYKHSSMVYRTCLRILHHSQEAEEAFQATFLVLFHRAASLRDPARPWKLALWCSLSCSAESPYS